MQIELKFVGDAVFGTLKITLYMRTSASGDICMDEGIIPTKTSNSHEAVGSNVLSL